MATWEIQTWSPVVEQVISWTGFIGTGLLSSFVALKLGYEYFRASLGFAHGGGMIPIDFNELARVLLLVIVINIYVPIAKSFTYAVREINQISQLDSQSHGEVAKQFNDYYVATEKIKQRDKISEAKEHLKYLESSGKDSRKIENHKKYIEKLKKRNIASETNGTPLGDSVKDGEGGKVEEKGFFDTGFIEYTICMITMGIMMVIKVIMGSFISMVFQIGLIIGPLVIAMSMFWKNKLPQYLEKMLSVGLTFTTFNLIDLLVSSFLREGMFNDAGLWETIAFNLTCIGVYLSAFKVTSMFIGSTGLGGVANSALSSMAAGAGATAWLGSKMAGAAAGRFGGGGSSGSGGGSTGGSSAGGGASVLASAARSVQKGADRVRKTNVE